MERSFRRNELRPIEGTCQRHLSIWSTWRFSRRNRGFWTSRQLTFGELSATNPYLGAQRIRQDDATRVWFWFVSAPLADSPTVVSTSFSKSPQTSAKTLPRVTYARIFILSVFARDGLLFRWLEMLGRLFLLPFVRSTPKFFLVR